MKATMISDVSNHKGNQHGDSDAKCDKMKATNGHNKYIKEME
jgi:hypothetical protein